MPALVHAERFAEWLLFRPYPASSLTVAYHSLFIIIVEMNLQFRLDRDTKATDNFFVHKIFLNGVSIGTVTEYVSGKCSSSFQFEGSRWSAHPSNSFVEAKALVATILASALGEKK